MKDLFSRIKGYLAEVKGEAHRVSWPGKHELYDSTYVVIAFIFILALTTFVCDTGIRWVLTVLFPDMKS